MIAAENFSLVGDKYYIFDEMSCKIDIYSTEKYFGHIPMNQFRGILNFIATPGSLIFSTYNSEGPNTIYHVKDSLCDYFGEVYPFKTVIQEKLRNSRYVCRNKNKLFTISNNIPVIEEFDWQSKILINHVNLENYAFFQEVKKYVDRQSLGEYDYYTIISNIYMTSNHLYLLCADWKPGYSLNKIMVLDISSNEIKPLVIYCLKGRVYSSFCVDEVTNRLFAANVQASTIEVYELNKDRGCNIQ